MPVVRGGCWWCDDDAYLLVGGTRWRGGCWMAVAARLSQCMMRPGGVASLVLCLHARGGEAPEAQPAVEELTVRLLRSVPAAGG